MIENLLTPQQVAQFLGLSEAHLARWRMDKTGPSFLKLGSGRGGKIRYPETALAEFLKSRTFTTTPKINTAE